jgi:hypothetical protein
MKNKSRIDASGLFLTKATIKFKHTIIDKTVIPKKGLKKYSNDANKIIELFIKTKGEKVAPVTVKICGKT